MNEPTPFMRTPSPGYEVTSIRCAGCLRCWVRQVPVTADTGNWLCPRGWSHNCPSRVWERVDRPDVMAGWLLAGLHAFGDMEGAS